LGGLCIRETRAFFVSFSEKKRFSRNRKIFIVIQVCIPMPQETLRKNILHYPQLDTILMVEEFIRDNSGEYKKKSLWEALPRKMIYQTFCVIFDYLLESGKITQDKEGWVVWIWNPELVRKYLSKSYLSR